LEKFECERKLIEQKARKMKNVYIFGGAGFIGVSYALYLTKVCNFDKAYLVDTEPVGNKFSEFRKKQLTNNLQIFFIKGDVRSQLDWLRPREPVTLIANFAAIHREPGHEDFEYFETNLLGAQNICKFAENIKCNQIIFTSSISPYGLSEAVRDESSIPNPNSPYGSSKLAAEKIHQIWQAKDPKNRILQIVRPGVVFGPGEGGNVSRLIKAVLHRYFFYMGNKETRKAGVYVKELCHAMWWELNRQKNKKHHVSLFNMTMNPGPSIQDYVKTVCKVAKVKRFVPIIPFRMLLIASYFIEFIAKPFNIKHPFSPVRIKKLVRSNNILPTYLVKNGYKYQYTLESAFLDWKKECPEEWQ
jgi:nucleoside-diphosphate-sugar epimerase